MSAISEWVNSVGGWLGRTKGRDGPETDVESEPREKPEASLFSCPDCDAVYIAIDKDACSTCETDVEEVPPASFETG